MQLVQSVQSSQSVQPLQPVQHQHPLFEELSDTQFVFAVANARDTPLVDLFDRFANSARELYIFVSLMASPPSLRDARCHSYLRQVDEPLHRHES